jgi:transcriptional regulator with XRE-family HTH domain
MIRSEAEYKDAVARSKKSAEHLVAYREELSGQGLSTDEAERAIGLAVYLLDDMECEIRRYEKIRRGDLSDFKSLREIGQLLVAARLARGSSQRDLAERLNVHESQVSRDERNEYQGVSLERAAQILEALSVGVEIRVSLEQEIGDRVRRLEGEEEVVPDNLLRSGDTESMSKATSFAHEISGGARHPG